MPVNAVIETGNRVQLPAEWLDALGARDVVVLDQTPEGILIRPRPTLSWDEVFAKKLVIGSARSTKDDDEDLELTGDDFLF